MHYNQKEKQRLRKISFTEAKEKVILRVKWFQMLYIGSIRVELTIKCIFYIKEATVLFKCCKWKPDSQMFKIYWK